jgi:hypothetical protein
MDDTSIVTLAHVDDNTLCNRYIIESFPKSQFRPVLLHYGIHIPLTESINWQLFAADIDHVVRFIPACSDSNAIRAAAKRHVQRGFRKAYIPGCNQDC